ncbi:hypothetical protein [Compostibacter hankyongensis]|uniref:Uncharacterized protein n=1 Tax=Compostibacter hankyongensis TaxID=1007089 RepID=A0ABP8FUP6_9BACT
MITTRNIVFFEQPHPVREGLAITRARKLETALRNEREKNQWCPETWEEMLPFTETTATGLPEYHSWTPSVLLDHITQLDQLLFQDLAGLQTWLEELIREDQTADTHLVGIAQYVSSFNMALQSLQEKEAGVLYPCIREYLNAGTQNKPLPRFPFGSIVRAFENIRIDYKQISQYWTSVRTYIYHYTTSGTSDLLQEKVAAYDHRLQEQLYLKTFVLFPLISTLE